MRLVAIVVPLTMVLACTEPETVIVGQFGGRFMGLTAAAAGQFVLPCGQITTPALRTDQAGVARVSGTAVFQGAGIQPFTVDVEVQIITGRHLRVTFGLPGSSTTNSYDIFRDQPADLSGVGCLD